MTQDPTPAEKPPISQALGINLPGVGIFALSLAGGLVVRLFIPDAIMYGPKTPFSDTGGIVALTVTVPFLLWLAWWFRSPQSPRLTAVGAAWSAGLAALTAVEIWQNRDWALFPGLAIIASFALMTGVAWWRMRRAAPGVTPT